MRKSRRINAFAQEACRSRKEALDGMMEALTCGDNYTIIGVWGPESKIAHLLLNVSRTAKRDELFDVVVKSTVSNMAQ